MYGSWNVVQFYSLRSAVTAILLNEQLSTSNMDLKGMVHTKTLFKYIYIVTIMFIILISVAQLSVVSNTEVTESIDCMLLHCTWCSLPDIVLFTPSVTCTLFPYKML